MGDTQVYIVEHSVVSPAAQVMETRLKNITLQTYMTVDETCTWRATAPSADRPLSQHW